MNVIRLQVPEDDAVKLMSEIAAANITQSSSTSRQMTGETILVSIVVPATLAAIQIVSNFLISRKSTSKEESLERNIRISVNGVAIQPNEFSRENVEEIINIESSDE